MTSIFYIKHSKNQEKIEIKSAHCEFKIDKPELWYPNGLLDRLEQPLYSIKIEIKKEDKILDSIEKKIGLRKLVLEHSSDCQ